MRLRGLKRNLFEDLCSETVIVADLDSWRTAAEDLVKLGLAEWSKRTRKILCLSTTACGFRRSFPGGFPSRNRTTFRVACHKICEDTLRAVRDDKDRMLAKSRADVGSKALRTPLKVGTRGLTPVVLRPDDVKGKAGLPDAEEDSLGGRDGVAGEVPIGSGLDGCAGLGRVNRSPKRRATKWLTFPKTHEDAYRARRDGAAQSHVLRVAQEEAAKGGWARKDFLIAWFNSDGSVSVLASHVAPDQFPEGWTEWEPGVAYKRVIASWFDTELHYLMAKWGKK